MVLITLSTIRLDYIPKHLSRMHVKCVSPKKIIQKKIDPQAEWRVSKIWEDPGVFFFTSRRVDAVLLGSSPGLDVSG